MNNLMKLSSPIASKLMTVLVCGMLVVNGMFSMRSLEIRAFFVSVDMIQHDPMLLEIITVTKLNDIIIESFICDFGDKKGALPVKDAKGTSEDNSPVTANCTMAMIGNATHLILAGLSQETDRKAQLDSTITSQLILYSGTGFVEQQVDSREWLRNAEDAVSAIKKTLTSIDMPRAGIEANMLAQTLFTRPLLV